MAAAEDELITNAGDYELEALYLHTSVGLLDLKEFFIELHIYEDIYSASLSGNLVLADAVNLISATPLRGDEALTIKARTPTLEDTPENIIYKTFQVYGIKDRIANNDGSQYYNICFTSMENFADNLNTISKTFRGTTDEIAAQIFNDYIRNERVLGIEGESNFTELAIYDAPHRSNLTYTSNYWTPFKNLSFISKRVRGKGFDGADYLFFESNKNFYFASVEVIIAAQIANGLFDEYVYERDSQNIPRRKSGFDFVGNVLPSKKTSIESISIKETVDYIQGQMSGMFASSIYGYDLSTKKFVQTNFNYVEEAGSFIRTDVGLPFPKDTLSNPRSYVDFVMFNSSLYNDYGKTDNENLPSGFSAEHYSDRHLFRRSYLNNLNNHVVEMTIPGRTDIQVGQLISILYPNASIPDEETKDIDTIFDPIMTGAYLITAIHHKFTSERHVMITEAVKNGYRGTIGVENNAEA